MFKQWMAGVFATGVFASPPSCAADDSGFYVGLGVGQAHNEAGPFRLDDSVVKAFAGFAFNDYFATGEREAASASDDDLAWGLGTAVKIGEGWSVRFEYEAGEVSEGAFDAVTVSGTVRF